MFYTLSNGDFCGDILVSQGAFASGLKFDCPVLQAEAPIDPTKELSRLVAEHKYDEAFTAALHRSDVSIVSWLCSQVQGLLLRANACIPSRDLVTQQQKLYKAIFVVSTYLQ